MISRSRWRRSWGLRYHADRDRPTAAQARRIDKRCLSTRYPTASLRSGGLLNYSELARDTGISVDTARRYLEYLRISYQNILLPPYHANLTSTVVKSPKIYWLDIGLMRQLSGIHTTVTGEIYETLVVGEMLKWVKTTGKDAELYFYRTRSGREVDLLLETASGIIGIEIKSRKTIVPKDTTALKEIASALGSRWRGGMVVYPGDVLQQIADPQIWSVPSRRLFT